MAEVPPRASDSVRQALRVLRDLLHHVWFLSPALTLLPPAHLTRRALLATGWCLHLSQVWALGALDNILLGHC